MFITPYSSYGMAPWIMLLGFSPELGLKIFWGYSILYKQFLLREDAPRSVGSVGRAHRSHRWGHWFESSTDHQSQRRHQISQSAFVGCDIFFARNKHLYCQGKAVICGLRIFCPEATCCRCLMRWNRQKKGAVRRRGLLRYLRYTIPDKRKRPCKEGVHTKYINYHDTLIGKPRLVEEDGAIIQLVLDRIYPPVEGEQSGGGNAPLHRLKEQLDEYFDGKRRTFEIPIRPKGTAFQLRDWEELQRIPYGGDPYL